MGCRLLRMGMVGLSLAALALPIRSAGAQSSFGGAPLVAAEQLYTHADGSFTSLAALALPIRSAGAQSSSGRDPLVLAEQLCTQADGSFTVLDNLHYTCEGEDLHAGLVEAAKAFCTHAFSTGGSFTRETTADGTIMFYDCLVPGA